METENTPVDVRASIEAAYDDLASQPGSDLPQAEPDIDDLAPAQDGRSRDDKGRFAPKDSNESASAPVEAKPELAERTQTEKPAEPVQTEAPTGATMDRSAPPQRVGTATKAAWNELPEAIRNEIWEREERMDRGMARYAGLAEFAVEAEKNGQNLREVMQNYKNAEESLMSNPVATLAEFCKLTNTNPLQVAQFLGVPVGAHSPAMPQSAPQGTPPIYADPRVDELLRRVQQREAMEAAREAEKLGSEVETFLSNTKQYPYAENVRVLMGQLLERDLAASLEDAYQKAIYLDPSVRKLVEEEAFKTRMSTVQQQQQAQNARVVVRNAKQSSGSLYGSPIAGGSSSKADTGPKSVADTIREAYDSLAG